MAIVKDFQPGKVYISTRLKSRLRTVLTYPLTIVESPTGYGKTTVIKYYLEENNVKFNWFNIDTTDKEEIFRNFCFRMDSISEECAKKLRSIGFPKEIDDARNIAKAILEIDFNEKNILVLDNYHLISDDMLNIIIQDLSLGQNKNFKVICLTQSINSKNTFELVQRKKINYIGKSDFEFTKDEIFSYYENCGIELNKDEVDFLFQYTEGWAIALYLQMLSYVTSGCFEPTVSVDNLVCKAIWNNLNRKEQDFLITMSIYPNFSFGQSMLVASDILNESEMENLLDNNSFIKFDIKSRKYYIHTILKSFLEMEFVKLEPVFKKNIYEKAGQWYCKNEIYFKAIKYYDFVADYDAVLSMNYKASDIIPNISYKNKNIFINTVTKTTNELKLKHASKYFVFLFSLFTYNEKDLFLNESLLLEKLINSSDYDTDEKNYLLGELRLVCTLKDFNDLDKMLVSYENAFKLLNAPSRIFNAYNSIIFNNPSILSSFHSKPGELNVKLSKFEAIMPLIYKLFDGASKGAEALMKAEILFNQGNFNDASLLCDKAIYLAETRKQTDVIVCAYFLLGRIAYIKADFILINHYIDKLREVAQTAGRFDLNIMCDMCEGFIRILLDSPELLPSWLKNHNLIEKNCRMQNIGFANIIHGKYLLLKGKNEEFISISGNYLSTANCYQNIICKIYIYIFIAIANLNKTDNAKSKKLLIEAINLAYEDMLFIPFIENFSDIGVLLCDIKETKYKDFIDQIMNISKKYSKGMRVLKRAFKNDENYGLTNRELEVAKLAAQRLSNKEIADMLFIAESTVKSNIKGIFNKLGINSRNELKNFFE